jgi:cholesterol transport system auxiliary component
MKLKPAMLAALAGVMMAVLGGCASFGPQEARRYYVLDAHAPDASPGKERAPVAPRGATLLVAPVTVSGFYETAEIAYSRAPGMRAYYQLNAWTERPGRRLTDLLVMRLARAGSFGTVATAVSGVKGDVIISAHLAEFYHDAAVAPGSVRVAVTVELTDPVRRTLLARRMFVQSAPAPTYDAPGAVQAFNVAVTALLDDIAAWVEMSVPR